MDVQTLSVKCNTDCDTQANSEERVDIKKDQASVAVSPGFDAAPTNHFIADPECDQLLRNTKKQVKLLMQEAVVRKCIHIDSGCLVSLCVAVDACLTNGLKRRVLGLFKTSSSLALLHKLEKSCPAAQQILQSVEKYKLELLELEKQQQQQRYNGKEKRHETCNVVAQNQQQQIQMRRYIWIKFALIEKKLLEIIEYLVENANKYYESNALLCDYSCAQILLSLLIGPSALEFSRNKMSASLHFQEDPTAHDLIERHKLANPIACLCKQEVSDQNHCDNNNNDTSKENVKSSNKQPDGPIKASNKENNKLHKGSLCYSPRSFSMKSKSRINRRRTLSIKLNPKRPTLTTECHHYSCQEITEQQQLRGYSMLTNLRGPLSAPSRGSFLNQPSSNRNSNTQHQLKNNNNDNDSLINKPANQLDNSWSLWSPRVLHQIMHQNPHSKLIYGKNNILLESETCSLVPGYLSLHEEGDDLVLKWIPNRMINGVHSSAQIKANDAKRAIKLEGETKAGEGVDEDNKTSVNNTCSNQNTNNPTTHDSHSIKEPTPIESSYLDLVVSIPISRIVLLHCRFRSSSIEILDDTDPTNSISTPNAQSESQINANEFSEETLIFVEADGIQHAPFRFPKGGLRLFLSCLETNLIPTQRYLDPAVSLDRAIQWPQHPLSASFRTQRDGVTWGRSTPLGHSNSFGNSSKSSPGVDSDERYKEEIEPCLGRFDSLLNRFPSFRRRVRTKHSSSSEEKTQTTKPSILNRASSDQNRDEATRQLHKFAPTNNYIYRIISIDQHTSNLQNSITGCSNEPPAIESDRKPENRFIWSLRRWTNFSGTTNQPTPDHPSQQPLSLEPLAMNGEQADSSSTSPSGGTTFKTLESVTHLSASDLSPTDELSNLRSERSSSQYNVDDSDNWDNNSLKLARIEAKLSDIKKSTSEEVLETFRTQSIETLCKSMRKQIMARAFYGWLVHCRRSKMIRKHLSHLLRMPKKQPFMEGDEERFCIKDNPLSAFNTDDHEEFSGGLTQARWKNLLLTSKQFNEGVHDAGPDVIGKRRAYVEELIARRVSSYVYFGGIESDELRKEVWPYLLRNYNYLDGPDDVLEKDLGAKKAYEECSLEWVVIEREVSRRDGEILAANIARAKRESGSWIRSSGLSNRADMKSVHVDDDHRRIPKSENTCDPNHDSNCTVVNSESCGGAIANNGGDNSELVSQNVTDKLVESTTEDGTAECAAKVLMDNNESELLKDCKESSVGVDGSLASRPGEATTQAREGVDNGAKPTISLSEDDKVRSDNESVSGESRVDCKISYDADLLEAITAYSSSLSEEACSLINIDSNQFRGNEDVEHDDDDKISQLDTKQARQTTSKRWRLESTGSVGSDAPITEQFGNNIHRIDKDVQRCDRSFWFFKEKQNLDKLRNIMCTYVWQNLSNGYVQGMCDLAAPFLVIFDGNEVQAFQCFNQLMRRMVDNFPLGKSLSPMDQHFEALRYLIQLMDPKLFQVLRCFDDDNSCFAFCYRWFLLDFKRELAYEHVYLVWETIWAARDIATDHFVVFLALAMVRYYRDIIIENNMDYTDTLKFFNEMSEKHDIRRVLELARESIVELYLMMNE